MTGKFTLIKETEFATLDWGKVAALCNPSSTGAKQLTILDGKLFPGKGHDFHKHAAQEEVILVVSGKIEQWLDQDKLVLGPGDSVFVPPNTVHASFNVGTEEAHILAIFGPSVGKDGLENIDMSEVSPWKGLRPKGLGT
jgi:quercetin dioxygenase-like cupin family protein